MLQRIAVAALLSVAFPAFAQNVPAAYPADYAQTITAARKEGKVVIYSALDTKAAQPLIKDFTALYPDIKVEYNDMNSTEMYNRFIAESASGQAGADVMWSSAMDLQVKLVDEGHAMSYASPEAPKLPQWAVYKNQAYGTTYEPAVFIYNKRLVSGNDVPQDHAAFARVLNGETDKFKGKVTTYDIEKSGVGFMFVVQDTKYFPGMKDLEKGFGRARPGLQHPRLLRARARQEGSQPGRRAAEGLHARTFARAVHREEREESERGEAVDRLHPVDARTEADRQRRRAVRHPQRRRRRVHGRFAQQAARQ
jgi:iron(III) transport system substrate-binding protein